MKFSVIVANYNNTKYLAELIKSVENQSYSNWELVIADDFSTDQIEDFIKPYLTNPKIKFIRHNQNKGAGATFKTAMDNSTGDVIGMLGADDALREDALEKMMTAHLNHLSASLINSRLYFCDENLNIREEWFTKKVESRGSLLKEFCVSSFATFKRSFYTQTEGFNPKLRRSVDYDLYFKLEEVGEIELVDEPLYYYRLHKNGISQFDNSIKAHLYQIMTIKAAYQRRKKQKDLFNISKDKMLHYLRFYYLSKAIYNITHKQKMKAFCNLIKLLYYIPGDINNRLLWDVIAFFVGIRSTPPLLIKLH